LKCEQASCDQHSGDGNPAYSGAMLAGLESSGWLRVPDSITIEIYHVDTDAVFHLAFAEVVKKRSPPRVLSEIIGNTFRQQNVTVIAAIHHALGHVYSGSCDVGLLVQVSDLVHRTAVNAHAHAQFRMIL
jgi:hypothetical protein